MDAMPRNALIGIGCCLALIAGVLFFVPKDPEEDIGVGGISAKPYTIVTTTSTQPATTTRMFGTLSPQKTALYDLGESAYSWRDIYASGTIKAVNMEISGTCSGCGSTSSYFGPIEWSNATGTNTTSTNLYATTGSFASLLATNATGTSLEVSGLTQLATLAFTHGTSTSFHATTLCLTGDSCITAWPAAGTALTPQLTQVINVGSSATSTPSFDMGFTATTGTITNATTTNLDVSTRFGFSEATGTALFATSLGSTSFSMTNATGATLALTGNFSAGSSTVTTLHFSNATGTNLDVSTRFGFSEATGTSLYAASLGASSVYFLSATGTNLTLTGNFAGTSSTITTLDFSNATGTRLFSTNVVGTYGTFTDVTSTSLEVTATGIISNLIASDITFTNATGTSFEVSGLTQLGNLTVTNATATTFEVSGLTQLGDFTWSDATGTSLELTGTLMVGASGDIIVSGAKRTLILSGAGGACATTAGCSATQYEYTTNRTNSYGLDFGASSTQYAHWNDFVLPDNYDGGTVDVTFYFVNHASGTGSIHWGIQAKAVSDGEYMDGAWGTPVYATGTHLQAGYLEATSTLSALTIAGTPADGDMIFFRAFRLGGSDTFGTTSTLHAIKLEYGINSYSD